MKIKNTEKYDLLLNSALEIFVNKGFHATKIKDITEKASVGTGTFYLYFKNKDDILQAIFEKNINNGFDKMDEIVSSDLNAKEKLTSYIQENINIFRDNQNFLQLIINSHVEHSHHKHFKKKQELIKRQLRQIENILIQGQIENFFRENINIKVISRSLRGMLIMNLINFIITPDEEDFNNIEISNSITETLLTGISR